MRQVEEKNGMSAAETQGVGGVLGPSPDVANDRVSFFFWYFTTAQIQVLGPSADVADDRVAVD